MAHAAALVAIAVLVPQQPGGAPRIDEVDLPSGLVYLSADDPSALTGTDGRLTLRNDDELWELRLLTHPGNLAVALLLERRPWDDVLLETYDAAGESSLALVSGSPFGADIDAILPGFQAGTERERMRDDRRARTMSLIE